MTEPGREREMLSDEDANDAAEVVEGQESLGLDAGAFVGHHPELGDEIEIESTGPAGRGANPDEGWQRTPEGHREGRGADDDLLREA